MVFVVDGVQTEPVSLQPPGVRTGTAVHERELLTTGEAASLLGSSRQHVVDLCTKGYLPFEIVGTHRRVRRSDVVEFQSRTTRMTRDQRRSLWMGHAVAGAVVRSPSETMGRARANLTTMRAARGPASNPWLEEWQRLLDGPVETVLEALTSPTPRARELRQNSPFAGVLDQEERRAVLCGFAADDRTRARAETR